MQQDRGDGRARGLVALLRTKQWVKNAFVLAAPFFGHALTTAENTLRIGAAVVAFCCLSSAIYIINDIVDADADRHHRTKRSRPLASGAVATETALLVAIGMFSVATILSALLGREFALVAAVYLVNSLCYSLFLKQFIILDVLAIALGFMLRIIAGAVVVGVEPSSWLMICGFSLALFLAFCKRRSELGRFFDINEAVAARAVFAAYSEEKLNALITATAAMTVMTYMLFTVAPETVERHGTGQLIFSSPIVVYGVFKFLMVTLDLEGEDTADVLLGDPGSLVAAVLWILCVGWIL